MSRRDEHLDDVLCQCDGSAIGHPLTAPGCAATVKAGSYGTGWRWYGLNPPTTSAVSADILAELARVTTDPVRRRQYQAQVRILRAADAEWRAQDRLATSLYRERNALEDLRIGTPAEKRKAAVALPKTREALARAQDAARELRTRHLAA